MLYPLSYEGCLRTDTTGSHRAGDRSYRPGRTRRTWPSMGGGRAGGRPGRSVTSLRCAGVWVCLCRAVTSGTIAEVVESGARTVRQVSEACGAGTDCTKCTRTIRVLIATHAPGPDQEVERR